MARSDARVFAFAGLLAACTAFDGLEPDLGGASSVGGGSAAAGGAGGDDPASQSLLPLLDAANVCSLVQRCPTLGGSLLLSSGLPLVRVEPTGLPAARNYSACIDWLRAPLAQGHPGFEELRRLLLGVAATSVCEEAESLLPVSVGASCPARDSSCVDAETSLACPDGVSERCTRGLFAPGSTCLDVGAVGCAVGECSAEGLTCDAPFAFRCAAGLRTGLDCSLLGLACEGGVGCVGIAGPAECDTIGEQSCGLGERLARTCVRTFSSAELIAAELDCEALGQRCVVEGLTARCAPDQEACSPYDPDVNVCEGTTIRLCVQGEPTTVDCGILGKTCEPASPDGPWGLHEVSGVETATFSPGEAPGSFVIEVTSSDLTIDDRSASHQVRTEVAVSSSDATLSVLGTFSGKSGVRDVTHEVDVVLVFGADGSLELRGSTEATVGIRGLDVELDLLRQGPAGTCVEGTVVLERRLGSLTVSLSFDGSDAYVARTNRGGRGTFDLDCTPVAP
jgi:hypothetical protein